MNHYAYKMCLLYNYLHFIEIKSVLEGRGFRPKFLGTLAIAEQ